MMDILCAWCDKKIGEKETNRVTYGICDDCLNTYFPHHADIIRDIAEVKSIEEIYQ